jgi:hypothetical protein
VTGCLKKITGCLKKVTEDCNMSNRFHNWLHIFFLLVLTSGVACLSADTGFSADTYIVPRTAEVTLAWDPNNPVPDGYRVYQRTEGQAFDYNQPVRTGLDTSCTVYNLDHDITYYFVVRAYTGDMESADSNEVSFLSPSSQPDVYTISASTGGNGSISPSGTVTVYEGADQAFAVSPGTGCHVLDVLVDGVSVGAVSSYTFRQVGDNHTISAEFAPDAHIISASSGANGSISPSGVVAVNHGAGQGYTITPASGYHVADVLVDARSVGAVSEYLFNQVVADHTIHAAFTANIYSISASAGSNGTITPSGSTSISFGGSQAYTLSPDGGCMVADVIVDGVSVGCTGTYTFSDVRANHTIVARFASENQSPAADAGPDQTVDEGGTVTLSGLNSFDPDDGIAAFQWRQIQGVEVILTSPDEPETTFIAPDVDMSGMALVFELTVTDYSGAASVDTCIVNVTWVNMVPTADAGADQTVEEGTRVFLNASGSTDPDDGIVSYQWKQLLGPAVTLTDAGSATPAFQTPDVGPEGASMTFELTVADAGGLQDTDACLVNVAWVNTPPVANAGSDREAAVGEQVILDGSQSTDADEPAIASFRWRQTEGVPAELSDATAQRPVFVTPDAGIEGGVLTFELTVTDSGGLMGTDTCRVSVAPAAPAADTTAPTVKIERPSGDPLTVRSSRISLSGTARDDREVARVTWKNSSGGSGVAQGSTAWYVDRIGLKRGKNRITVTAYDTSGNQSTVTKTICRTR